MFQFNAPPPLTLYLHLPWCVKKCPYCDFNSHEAHTAIPQTDYIDALLRDLEQDLPLVWGRRVHAIYLGGGTPSLFDPQHVQTLLSQLRARLNLNPDAEINMEANPGTVELERFQGYREAGINRLSIGIQSFEQEKLQALGRIHGHDEALHAAQAARDAGFDNFNLDLMFGLPGQSLEQALQDVQTAIDLAPTHMSLYQLTLEPNTYFHKYPPQLPPDDSIWDMQQQLQARLADAGYAQYEVSAYARKGYECKHNLNYWRFGDYLGVGAGAHAKLSRHDGITRLWKLKQPKAYMQAAGTAAGIAGQRQLDGKEAGLEFMMNALRLTQGFATPLFQERSGQALASITAQLQQAEAKGLINWDIHRIQATQKGRQFLNESLLLFMPD